MPDVLNPAGPAAARSTIRDYLKRISRKPDLSDDQDIFGSGIVDSLFAVEIVCFIEETFGLKVENEDLDISNFSSVDALSGLVERKTSGA